jgi:hypothetical protein
MILDEGCAERGCPMHDERETKGVEFIRRGWVGLRAEEIEEIQDAVFGMKPHYVALARAVEAKLKEKNA